MSDLIFSPFSHKEAVEVATSFSSILVPPGV
jgi:hypothetical protein